MQVVIATSGVVMDAADAAALEKKVNVTDMMPFLLPTSVEGVKASLKFLLLKPIRMPDSAYQEILEVSTFTYSSAKCMIDLIRVLH